MRADEVYQALANKHRGDLFATEVCTNGQATRRVDAIAINRSWAHWTVTIYEVKVSRQDFMRDVKVGEYADYCHELYIVAPDGVLDPRELPQGVGWMRVTNTGGRLVRKVRAVRRDSPPLLHCIYHSLAINRMVIKSTEPETRASRIERVRRMVEDNADAARIGRTVGGLFAERMAKLQEQNDHLRGRIEDLQKIADLCRRLGVDPDHPWAFSAGRVEQALDTTAVARVALVEVKRSVENLIRRLEFADERTRENTAATGGGKEGE